MYDCQTRLKILIVDHEQFEADLLEKLITEYGHNGTTTIKSAEAISLISEHFKKKNPYDLVFTEFMLDGITCIELCKKLRAIDPSLTIVINTGDNSVETKIKIAKAGNFSAFISKTAEIANIKRALDIAMSNKKEKMSGEKSVYSEANNLQEKKTKTKAKTKTKSTAGKKKK